MRSHSLTGRRGHGRANLNERSARELADTALQSGTFVPSFIHRQIRHTSQVSGVMSMFENGSNPLPFCFLNRLIIY